MTSHLKADIRKKFEDKMNDGSFWFDFGDGYDGFDDDKIKDFIDQTIDTTLSSAIALGEEMKYNNNEPGGCDCGGDTKNVIDSAITDYQSKLKEMMK